MLNSKKEKLIQVLNNELNTHSLDKEFQERMTEILEKRNLEVGEITRLLRKMSPLEMQDEMTLYFVADSMHKVLGIKMTNPERYYTEPEIENYKSKAIKREDKIEYPLRFKPVIKINENEYTLKMNEKQIDDLFAKRILTYNPAIQRPLKTSGDIDINKTSIKEIAHRIIEGEQKIDHITINVLDNGEDVIEYDEETLELVICSGELNIIDGFHRSMGVKRALSLKPDIKFNLGVDITNYDEDDGNDFIVQKDKRNPINKSYIKRKDPNRLENKILDRLDDKKKCDIAGLISFKRVEVNKGNALTTTDILIGAIEHNFKFEWKAEAMKAGRFLVKFFNLLVSYFPEELRKNIAKGRDENYVNHLNTFIGYVAIASEIMDKNNWEDILEDTLNNINFNKDNLEWKEIDITKKKLTKSLIKEVSEFFKSKIVY